MLCFVLMVVSQAGGRLVCRNLMTQTTSSFLGLSTWNWVCYLISRCRCAWYIFHAHSADLQSIIAKSCDASCTSTFPKLSIWNFMCMFTNKCFSWMAHHRKSLVMQTSALCAGHKYNCRCEWCILYFPFIPDKSVL